MHGHGVIVLANGDIYDGAWANGMMEGSGTFKFKTGLYIGEMVQGLREGAGVLQMENGTKYTGQFQQNKYHGEVRSQTALEIVERGDHLSADGRQSCRRAGALMCVRARGWLVSEWLGSNVRGVGRRRESCERRSPCGREGPCCAATRRGPRSQRRGGAANPRPASPGRRGALRL